jgi:hypothetical protein
MAATEAVITAAIDQIEQGFAAFALRANAKVPVTERGFKNATTKADWIRKQLEAPNAGNYGIVWPESAPEAVLVLDLDNGSDGRERPWQDRLLDLIRTIGPLPPTKSTTTPSGGRHAFYRWPSDVPLPPGDELFGFTVRWPGRGYLVGPGSTINGVAYVAGPEREITDLPKAWVDAAVTERRSRRLSGDTITISGGFVLPDEIPSGRRYATVRDYVASRYNAGLSEDELWELVRTQVAPRFRVPKAEADLRSDFGRVMEKITERLGPPRHAAAAVPSGPLEDAPLTDFTSTPIEWLWPGWLPRGVVTLMDGNPGVSKSTLVADLVARITTGREWPDGSPNDRIGRAMWITTEDDPGRVLRPRIEAAGGDSSLVRFVTSEVVFPSGAGAFRELVVQRASEPLGLALVILDPLFSHIEATVRTIADAEMRRGVMNPLNAAAEAANVSVLVVRHFSKDQAASAINRGAGSLGGIVGAARALWSVVPDPEDETGDTKAVGVAKLNYAKPPAALRYRVADRVPPGWVSGTVAGIEWLGEAPVSVGAMLTETADVRNAVDSLRELIAGGEMDATTAFARMKARGFGNAATKSAKARLGLTSVKKSMSGGWTWVTPAEEVGADSFEEVGADSLEGDEEVSPTPSTSSRVHAGGRGRGGTNPSTSSSSSKESKESKESALPAPAYAREGRCPDCHRDIELDTVGRLRPHYPDGELGNAKWGVDPCAGSAARPEAA